MKINNEKNKEKELIDFYEQKSGSTQHDFIVRNTIYLTLHILGIKIKGINE